MAFGDPLPAGSAVVIGRIVRPFGIRGEVKIRPETDYPELFLERKDVWVGRSESELVCFRVSSRRLHQGDALLVLDGIDSIEAAEGLRGHLVAIPEEDLPELEEGTFWVDDVIGIEAFTEGGESLGVIREIIPGTANDVWVTDTAMIPAVREFVLDVDTKAGRAVIRDVEGLRTDEP